MSGNDRENSKVQISLVSVPKTEDFMAEFLKNKFITEETAQKYSAASRSFGSHIFIFNISVKSRNWQIRRRYQDFVALYGNVLKHLKKQKKHLENELPKLFEGKNLSPGEIGVKFTLYLQVMADKIEIKENCDLFWEFIEHGRVNLDESIIKFKEGNIYKRSRGRYREKKLWMYFGTVCRIWKVRWFVVCLEGVLYTLNSGQTKIREMLLFDSSFTYLFGGENTGTKKGIDLITPTRKLCLRAFDIFQVIDWVIAIEYARSSSPYTRIHRYLSFAPVREEPALCKFYVDGANYYSEMCDELNKARKEIFITGWWISPEIYLKRPVSPTQNQDSRLDRVLKSAADRGVKIHIILYKEFSFSLVNDSKYTKRTFEALSENIEVLTHPGNLIFMWSHHEKMVLIDQTIGFMGGFDLCWGRNDSNHHPLSDEFWLSDPQSCWYPGIDYYNVRVKDFKNVQNYAIDMYDKNTVHRMPWHDVALMITGDTAKDMSRHFIQYWNYVKSDLAPKNKKYFLTPQPKPDQHNLGKDEWVLEQKETFSQRIGRLVTRIFRDPRHENLELGSGLQSSPGKKNKINDKLSLPNEVSPISMRQSQPFRKNPQKVFYEEDLLNQKGYLESLMRHRSHSANPDIDLNQNLNSKLALIIEESDIKAEKTKPNEEKNHHLNNAEEERSDTEGIDFLFGNMDENPIKNEVYVPPDNFFGKDFKPIKNASRDSPNSSIHKKQFQAVSFQEAEILPSKQEMGSDMLIRQKKSASKERSLTVLPETQLRPSNSIDPQDYKRNDTRRIKSEIFNQPPLDNEFVDLIKKAVWLEQDKNEDIDYFVYRSKKDAKLLKEIEIATNKKMISLTGKSSDNKSNRNNRDLQGIKGTIMRHKKKTGLGTMTLNPNLNPRAKINGTCKCQLIRSASTWSLGLRENTKEASVQVAYLDLIRNAAHFIYIENQFFISGSAGVDVHNQISEAIILRIKKAALSRQKFRVIIMIPLLPGFEGDIDSSNSAVLKMQLHWEYQTICRGGTSILETLRKDPNISDPFDYIYFLSLRQHGLLRGEPKTELIYIHSKVLLIDDKIAVIGSANVNDRSMLGTRDSEICVIVEDEAMVPSKMDEEDWKAATFAYNLRLTLFKEHFGLSERELEDPVCNSFWQTILGIAKKNTEIFRKVFAPYPDDNVRAIGSLAEFITKKDLSLYETLSKEILGHAVEFPLRFLEEENLKFKIFDKEFYVPDNNFT